MHKDPFLKSHDSQKDTLKKPKLWNTKTETLCFIYLLFSLQSCFIPSPHDGVRLSLVQGCALQAIAGNNFFNNGCKNFPSKW